MHRTCDLKRIAIINEGLQLADRSATAGMPYSTMSGQCLELRKNVLDQCLYMGGSLVLTDY